MGDELVTYLEEQQASRGWTAREMAERLGLSETNWSHIRRRRRTLTLEVVERALRLFPDMASLVVSKGLEPAEQVPA